MIGLPSEAYNQQFTKAVGNGSIWKLILSIQKEESYFRCFSSSHII
jgi:hypothetical protein